VNVVPDPTEKLPSTVKDGLLAVVTVPSGFSKSPKIEWSVVAPFMSKEVALAKEKAPLLYRFPFIVTEVAELEEIVAPEKLWIVPSSVNAGVPVPVVIVP
jgi:hypothetical protein